MSSFNIIGKTVKIFSHGCYFQGEVKHRDFKQRKVLVVVNDEGVWIPEEYVRYEGDIR